ncbi:MAG: CBS domain-containing protein [Proteobacteria bacterium]|nr:CBS domain-containing protein [Pseudomonadota bacterium]
MKQVKDIMKKRAVSVNEHDDIRTVCMALSRHKVSGLPVLGASGKLVGFVSERDIISAVARPGFDRATARHVMTRRVKTISDDAPVTSASKIFSEEDYRLLPVVRDGRLVGMIGRKEVVNFMMGNYY